MSEDEEFKLPDMTQQSIKYVNATPDNMYPIRILNVYKENCNCKWSNSSGNIETVQPLFKLMNEQNDERTKILNKAIKILQEFGNIIGCKYCEDNYVFTKKCDKCSFLFHSTACHQFMKDDQMEYVRKNEIVLDETLLR